VLGITTYRIGWDRPHARVGLQETGIGDTSVWLLPNPSGLNAHYQLPDLSEEFDKLRTFAESHTRA
jgi:TDG/mug DNA glycosylase family protein